MAKAVILKTPEGVKLIGSFQCSNGAYWDAEGCYNYCNSEKTEFLNSHQAAKLVFFATTLGANPKTKEDWYKDRNNFVDIEIPYNDVIQEYDNTCKKGNG